MSPAFPIDPTKVQIMQAVLTEWKSLLLAFLLVATSGGCSRTANPDPTVASRTCVLPAPDKPRRSAVGNATSSVAETHLTEICRLIVRRLDLMPGVAQAKWNRKLPITDEKREQESLAKLAAAGAKLQLPEDVVTDFFRAQITAAKQVQEQAFKEWTAQQQAPFENPPSLENDIRPQIDEINGLLLQAISQCRSEPIAADWKMTVQRATAAAFESTSWSNEVIETATKPLYEWK